MAIDVPGAAAATRANQQIPFNIPTPASVSQFPGIGTGLGDLMLWAIALWHSGRHRERFGGIHHEHDQRS
jgi:hypothetical protein